VTDVKGNGKVVIDAWEGGGGVKAKCKGFGKGVIEERTTWRGGVF